MEIETTIRIHVGGLGETVTDEEIRNTFSKLGAVEAVDIVRTKGRSFAYVNFLPSSDKSLAKLFSTYNGCSWKGGKLRLEKARQHYLDKLKAEWAEAAEAEEAELAKKNKQDDDQKKELEEKKSSVPVIGNRRELDNKDEIRMFFPKISKVRSLPYRGTGKHKYSFQRTDVPPLPHHFCDCEEHSSRDVECVKPGQFNQNAVEKGGINEDEINIMNSVMNKLFQRENSSKRAPESRKAAGTEASEHDLLKKDGKDDTTDDDDDDNIVINTRHRQNAESLLLESMKRQQKGSTQNDAKEFGNLPQNQAGDDDGTDDDDNIVINMGGGHNDERLLLESMKQQQTRSAKKVKRLKKSQAPGYEHQQNELGVEKEKPSSKKAKVVKLGGSTGVSAGFVPGRENGMQKQLDKAEEVSQSSAPREESIVSAGKNKLKWKKLVDQKDNSSFTLSSLIPTSLSSKDSEPTEDEAPSVPSDDCPDPTLVDHVTDYTAGLDPVPSESKQSDSDVSSEKPDDGLDPRFQDLVTRNASSELVSSESQKCGGGVVSSDDPDNGQNTCSDPVSSKSKQSGGGVVSSEKPARGASWAQKSSWTQLVGGGSNNGAFSISQILTGTQKTSQIPRSQPSSTSDSLSKLSRAVKRPRNNDPNSGKQVVMSVPEKDKDSGGLSSKKEESEVRVNAEGRNLNSTASMEIDSPEKRDSSSMERRSDTITTRPTVTISETCPFMRSASSLQEWKTTKEALSRSLKRKKKQETDEPPLVPRRNQ